MKRLDSPGRELLSVAVATAKRQAQDATATPEARVAAIELLACFPLDDVLPMLIELLNAETPELVQVAAIRAMSSSIDPAVNTALLERWATFTPEPKRVALETMLSREDRIRAWLAAAIDGTVSAAEADSLQRDRLKTHANPQVKELAEKAFASVASSTRQAVIAEYQPVLEMKGRIDEGAKVFEKTCAACHLVGGKGVNIGPNLASNAAQNAASLLTHILDPNQYVLPSYVQYVAVDTNGVVHTGLLDVQTSTSITLKKEKAETITLLRREIEELTSTRKSLMPEGLEKAVPPEAMADLIAFLQEMTKKNPGDPNSERDRGTVAGTLIEED